MGKVMWAVSAVAYVASVAWAWVVLPVEGVAAHSDLAGHVDRYSSRGEFLGFSLGLAVLMLVLLPAICWAAMRGDATFLNMPHKQYWLAPERREGTLSRLRDQLSLFLAATNVLMIASVIDTVRLSSGRGGAVMLPALIAYIVFTIVWFVRFTREFRLPKDA